MAQLPRVADLEPEIRAAGRELFSHATCAGAPRLYRGVRGLLLRRAMNEDDLRRALFQFVDTLPQLQSSAPVADHLRGYLHAVPGMAAWIMRLAARPSLAWAVRREVRRFAREFLVDETATAIGQLILQLARLPAHATLDAIGEAVLTEAEADAYQARNLSLLQRLSQSLDEPPHLSLKLTALTPRFDPLDPIGTRKRVFARLASIVEQAEQCQATLTVDMEHHELKPLILNLFIQMLDAWPGSWRPAIALQTYLPETAQDVDLLLDQAQRHGRRLGVRLVKGAYWDQELAWAAQRNWPVPVFRDKGATDALHEDLTLRLMANSDCLHPAIASHNLRNQAVALAYARHRNLAPQRWEAQMLHGMAEPLRDAVIASGVTTRIYVPVGDPAIGIAYLIRRLLENTASTSILRQTYVGGMNFEQIMASPRPRDLTSRQARARRVPFTNLPLIDFSRAAEQHAFHEALDALRRSFPKSLRLDHANGRHHACNPADPAQRLGDVDLAGAGHADMAVQRSTAAFPAWRDTPVRERTMLLRRAADIMEAERRTLAALEVFEAAKNWREADADVAEAVDYLRYYALQMEALEGWRTTVQFPGEDNCGAYAPRGVAVIISPWNFPLAILAGMTSAALAAGNCAIMKPALPGLLVAHAFGDALRRAGIPEEVCQLLPGNADVGARLVIDPRVNIVAFTGSRAVGLHILQAAHTQVPGQRHVKQVVCEMGGKNAIIVDADADLDEAVAGILASAFGYAGQKCSACSRVIAVETIHDRLLERLCAAAATLPWGPPEDPAFQHGPLITQAAQSKALGYIRVGQCEGRMVWQGEVPDRGWYVPPTILAGIRPEHRLAREEVFGPVLAVMQAPDFDAAIAMAMDSDYALTGGVYSRLPAHLQLAEQRLLVGNLYLNRKTTGARVGIQPFGGVGLSGTGVQAGGPDYIKQFLWSRNLSANTMRHGFVPDQ